MTAIDRGENTSALHNDSEEIRQMTYALISGLSESYKEKRKLKWKERKLKVD